MSINAAMSAAMSGLSASARAAEVVGTNIANALNENYGRREVSLAVRTTGAGVNVLGVHRAVDQAVVADRRGAEAVWGEADALSRALSRIESAVGTPGEPGAMGTRIAGFEASLIEAMSRPDSVIRLDNVLRAAEELALGFNAAAREVQEVRADADRQIATGVKHLNASLARLAEINGQLQRHTLSGQDVNGLLDERQKLIDGVAELIPVREVPRPNGQVALYTDGGAVLLYDGRPSSFGFAGVPAVTAEMDVGNGALSMLTLGGRVVSAGPQGQLGGGRLGALFEIRDATGPDAQAGLDALARDLIARSEAADALSVHPEGRGLFTDAGDPLDPAAEHGLALRLAVNPVADPAQGGELWRLRAGLGANEPGAGGETAALSALADALAAPRIPGDAGFTGATRPFAGLAADLASRIGGDRDAAEARGSFAAARAGSLREMQLRGGVDTDDEMQKLLLIEQAYAANARVIQVADEMLQTLLRINP